MVTYKIHPGIGLARSAIRTLAMRTGLTVFEPSLWLRTRRLGIGDQRLAVDFPQMPHQNPKNYASETRPHRVKSPMCRLYLYKPEISR